MRLPRRTRLQRKAPLRARARLPAKRSKPRRGPLRHPGYLQWVRDQPCLAGPEGCAGRVHAHHAGQRGLGQRAPDATAIPLCSRHHQDWHDCAGVFRGWPQLMRWAWAMRAIAQTQAAYAARGVD